jgi:MFS family permease
MGKFTPARDLFGLCAATVVSFTVYNMVSPMTPLLLLDLGASPGLLGIVISVSLIGSTVVSAPGGILVNRWGSRRMMMVFGGLTALACAFLMIFPSIIAVLLCMSFFEIGKILSILGAQAHVASLGGNRNIDLDYGWYASSNAFGQMLGPPLMGFTLDVLGFRASWFLAFFLMAAISALLPLLISPGIVFHRPVDGNGQRPRKRFSSYLSFIAIIAILSSFLVIFADGARATFYPVLLAGFGYNATTIGVFMGLRGLVSMSFRFFMRNLIRLAGGRFPALIVSLFVLALGTAITPFCRGIPLLTLNALFVGAGLGMALPLSMAIVSAGTDAESRGVTMGIRLMGNRLAMLSNPVFFGSISEHFGLSMAFIAGGGFLFVTTLPILRWWRGGGIKN